MWRLVAVAALVFTGTLFLVAASDLAPQRRREAAALVLARENLSPEGRVALVVLAERGGLAVVSK